MQNKTTLPGSRFDIGQPYMRVLLILFAVGMLAKGAVIFRGFSIDDYSFMSGASTGGLLFFLSQGRYIMAATVWFIDSLGANINDLYFLFGIAAIFLQAALVVSILRFVDMDKSPSAVLVGALMIAHPYLAETLTYRVVLPGYCVAVVFSIMALEMASRSPATWGSRALSLLATLAMLLTYQVFLNYFVVAIIFSFLNGYVLHRNDSQPMVCQRQRALTLSIASAIATLAFLALDRATAALGPFKMTPRASLITHDMLPGRMGEIQSSLLKIYWSAEPIYPGWLKALVALMLLASVAIIFRRLLADKSKDNRLGNVFSAFFVFMLLIPVSLGVIVALKDWWPVPRVIAHVAIIVGLIFLVADSCLQDLGNRFVKSAIFVSRIVTLVGFLILSNQILADQQGVNQWDRMMANRIIARLELLPNFRDVRFVHIEGGSWDYPAKLRTVEGDMNVSAFYPDYSKAPLLSAVSGYRFETATGSKAAAGKAFCGTRQPWPSAGSIAIDADLAIICLKK